MQCNAKRVVYVCTDAEIRNEHYYRRLWLAVKNLKISRRQWLDELADCFCAFNGEVRYLSGECFQIPDLDEAFGDDCDMRWLSQYMASTSEGNSPKSKSRKLERLRLLDLYFRIRHPNIARHFGQ